MTKGPKFVDPLGIVRDAFELNAFLDEGVVIRHDKF